MPGMAWCQSQEADIAKQFHPEAIGFYRFGNVFGNTITMILSEVLPGDKNIHTFLLYDMQKLRWARMHLI
ncbi:hypothetical protein PT300_03475 [Enterobacteriaceae bacterium ESL0689]|nr:hypothetical protein [Enterobacteriaceae bacterium ESL0689]